MPGVVMAKKPAAPKAAPKQTPAKGSKPPAGRMPMTPPEGMPMARRGKPKRDC